MSHMDRFHKIGRIVLAAYGATLVTFAVTAVPNIEEWKIAAINLLPALYIGLKWTGNKSS